MDGIRRPIIDAHAHPHKHTHHLLKSLRPPTPHPPSSTNHTHNPTQYARAVLECDGFFLKFLEPFKRLRASDEAKAWVAGGTLAFEVSGVCVCVFVWKCGRGITDISVDLPFRLVSVQRPTLRFTPPPQKQTKTGVRPSLHLFAPGEEKEPSETVSVASWTAESMLEFLLDSLPAPATKTSGGSGKEEGEGGAGSHEEL